MAPWKDRFTVHGLHVLLHFYAKFNPRNWSQRGSFLMLRFLGTQVRFEISSLTFNGVLFCFSSLEQKSALLLFVSNLMSFLHLWEETGKTQRKTSQLMCKALIKPFQHKTEVSPWAGIERLIHIPCTNYYKQLNKSAFESETAKMRTCFQKIL